MKIIQDNPCLQENIENYWEVQFVFLIVITPLLLKIY